jgi:hypothetical protein
MDLTRQAGRALAVAGAIQITQKGQPVADVNSFKGPIRFRLAP